MLLLAPFSLTKKLMHREQKSGVQCCLSSKWPNKDLNSGDGR